MHTYHFEFWTADNVECQRVSIQAECYEWAKQILIGRYAPVYLRRIPSDNAAR